MFLFVYGSLKRRFKYHYILEPKGKFITEAKTIKKFSLYEYKDSGFPYMSEKESFNIKGELYEINDLTEIDYLEDYPVFYDRKKIKLIGNNGIKYEGYCYFLKEKIKEKKEPFNEWLITME